MVLYTLKLSGRHRPELTSDIGIAGRKPDNGAALDDEDDRVVDCLGREVVVLVEFKAKHFPDHIKAGDLPASVVKKLAAAHRSADHLVEVFGWLALAEDFHVAGV